MYLFCKRNYIRSFNSGYFARLSLCSISYLIFTSSLSDWLFLDDYADIGILKISHKFLA